MEDEYKYKKEVYILRRLCWVILTPLYLVNIIVGGILLIPYWIVTGEDYFETKYFKAIMKWLEKGEPDFL